MLTFAAKRGIDHQDRLSRGHHAHPYRMADVYARDAQARDLASGMNSLQRSDRGHFALMKAELDVSSNSSCQRLRVCVQLQKVSKQCCLLLVVFWARQCVWSDQLSLVKQINMMVLRMRSMSQQTILGSLCNLVMAASSGFSPCTVGRTD